MKTGAHSADQAKIKKMAAAGETAKAISEALRIELSVITSFMPKGAKPKTEEK